MITQPSFLFLTSFERLREKTVKTSSIENLLHMGRGIFGIDFGSIAFVIKKRHLASYKGVFLRLHERTFQYIEPKDIAQLYIRAKENHSYRYSFVDYTTDDGIVEQPVTPNSKQIYYEAVQDNFSKIPGSPVAYWVSEGLLSAFATGKSLGDIALARNGMKTGENGRFVRLWWEVILQGFNPTACDWKEASSSGAKWFPYNKGGEFRKWYGNNDCIVNWQNEGDEIFNHAKADKRNVQDYPLELKFKPSVSWSLVTSGQPAFRYKENNLSDIAGMSFFTEKQELLILLGFCNSKIALEILRILAPTINFQAGDIGRLPIVDYGVETETIRGLVSSNIDESTIDWDSSEVSWDFKRNPLV